MARAPARRHRRRLVTLTSDVGWAYAAQMKAILLRTLSSSQVVDLTHDLPRHAISEAAFVLKSIGTQYPAGTVHVAVVDPGVGGRRAPLILECADGSVLIGPDNGILAPLAQALGRPRGFRIDPDRLPVPSRVGTTFDGRDVFAPAAALVARGARPRELGSPHRFHDLRLPLPVLLSSGAKGEILHRDTFGNLISNIPTEWIPASTDELDLVLPLGRARRIAWASSYEALGRGRLGALGSSFGTVEVAVAGGRADRRCRAGAGDPIRLGWNRHGGARATRTVNSVGNLRSRRR